MTIKYSMDHQTLPLGPTSKEVGKTAHGTVLRLRHTIGADWLHAPASHMSIL